MDEIAQHIDKLLKLFNYDPDCKSFHSIDNFWIHSELTDSVDFINQWDVTGKFTLIHLSSLCRQYISNYQVDVMAVLNNPHLLDRFREMKSVIDSDCVEQVKTELGDSMKKFLAAMGGTKLLGDEEKFNETLEGSIYATLKELKKLRFEIYVNSGRPVSEFGKVSSKVTVFNSLAECITTLERGEDGMGVCYISTPGTIDGYFGFFMKSNGNLFSLNERCNEQYIGQHGTRRNGRYIYDAKAMDLFPYDAICKFEGGDYKGYATEIEINRELLDIFDTSKVDSAIGIRTLICFNLIARKYNKTILEGTPVVINSLLPQNLKQIDGSKGALVKVTDSAIVKSMNDFHVHFDRDKLIHNEYQKQFNRFDNPNQPYKGVFTSYNHELIEAYGDDFTFDDDDLLKSNSGQRLIGNGDVDLEFVGSREKMELQAYYEVRKRLAKHIFNRMKADYEAFGGRDAMSRWFNEQLAKQFSVVEGKAYAMCLSAFERFQLGHGSTIFKSDSVQSETHVIHWAHMGIEVSVMQLKKSSCIFNRWQFDKEKELGHNPFHSIGIPLDRNWKWTERQDPLTGANVQYVFNFEFEQTKDVERFLEVKTPKFCVGWKKQYPPSPGNSLLEVTDMIGELKNPMSVETGMGQSTRFDFEFSIYLSKSGLNKLEKKYPHKTIEEERPKDPFGSWEKIWNE